MVRRLCETNVFGVVAVTHAMLPLLRGNGIKVNAVSPGWVATDLNRHSGPLGVEQGATIPVRLATLPDDGPIGAFVSENGTPEGERAPW